MAAIDVEVRLAPPVKVMVLELPPPPVRVDKEGITDSEEVEVDDGGCWPRVVVLLEVRVEAPDEEAGRPDEEEEGGWWRRRNLMLEAVRKHEM